MILQQFDFDIVLKPAAQMTMPDALSRNIVYPECMDSSPEEEDPYFPYVEEKPTQIRVMTPNQTMEKFLPEVNLVNVYDADTEDIFVPKHKIKRFKSKRWYRDQLSQRLDQKLDLTECEKVVSVNHSQSSESEHSGDVHCSEAEQREFRCSPSEPQLIDQ